MMYLIRNTPQKLDNSTKKYIHIKYLCIMQLFKMELVPSKIHGHTPYSLFWIIFCMGAQKVDLQESGVNIRNNCYCITTWWIHVLIKLLCLHCFLLLFTLFDGSTIYQFAVVLGISHSYKPNDLPLTVAWKRKERCHPSFISPLHFCFKVSCP